MSLELCEPFLTQYCDYASIVTTLSFAVLGVYVCILAAYLCRYPFAMSHVKVIFYLVSNVIAMSTFCLVVRSVVYFVTFMEPPMREGYEKRVYDVPGFRTLQSSVIVACSGLTTVGIFVTVLVAGPQPALWLFIFACASHVGYSFFSSSDSRESIDEPKYAWVRRNGRNLLFATEPLVYLIVLMPLYYTKTKDATYITFVAVSLPIVGLYTAESLRRLVSPERKKQKRDEEAALMETEDELTIARSPLCEKICTNFTLSFIMCTGFGLFAIGVFFMWVYAFAVEGAIARSLGLY